MNGYFSLYKGMWDWLDIYNHILTNLRYKLMQLITLYVYISKSYCPIEKLLPWPSKMTKTLLIMLVGSKLAMSTIIGMEVLSTTKK